MSEKTGPDDEERQRKAIRRVGYGITAAGVLAVLVDIASTQPSRIIIFGFLGVAVAVFVLEWLEGGVSGLSVGLVFGSASGWLWPRVSDGSYAVLGVTLVIIGLANAVVAPYFRAVGERLAER